MAHLETASVLARIDQLMATQAEAGDVDGHYAATVEVLTGALTLARALYGDADETPQVHILMKAAQVAREKKENLAIAFTRAVMPAAKGALRAMRAEVEQGLVGNVERRAAGEVLGDMLALAKEALREGTTDTKDVAAVLTAAAYEDALRRLAAAKAGVSGRPPLQETLAALKSAAVLRGAAFTTAQGYLKFRNDSLHADWETVSAAVVGSCIAFTERLLLDHFG
ncbi:MAG: hypothetical protein KA745_03005 [Gemmatimonadales bacterium]|nr:hypothetical protein [Gemmatimonadales bacterium]